MKFRKKPVVIEAIQLQSGPQGQADVHTFTGGLAIPCALEPGAMIIPTLEDGQQGQVSHVASPGDWIIKGIRGEFYPCKSEIFAATYESVE